MVLKIIGIVSIALVTMVTVGHSLTCYDGAELGIEENDHFFGVPSDCPRKYTSYYYTVCIKIDVYGKARNFKEKE